MGKSKNKEIIIDVFLSFIIFVMSFYNISNLDRITILNDEFGYWGNSALLMGLGWDPLMQFTPYYSWGYSFLLVPIMKFIPNPETMYKVAIFYNVIFMIISYLCASYCTKLLIPKSGPLSRKLIAFISVFTVSSIYQMDTAWPEVLLVCLSWTSVALVLSVDKKFTVKKAIVFVLVQLYSVMVHQRMLPVVLLACMFFVLVCFKNKISIKYLAIVAIALVVVVPIYKITTNIHRDLLSSIINPAVEVKTEVSNDVIGNGGFVSAFISKVIGDFRGFLISFISKYMANNMATHGLILFSELVFVVRFFQMIKNRKLDNYVWSECYIHIACFAMIVLTAIQMCVYVRKDVIVYTRYSDNTIGPVVLLGLCSLKKYYKKYKNLYLFSMYSSIAALPFIAYMVEKSDGNFNVPCSPYIGGFYQFASKLTTSTNPFTWFSLIIVVFMLSCLILNWNSINSFSNKTMIPTFIMIMVINMFVSYYANDWLNGARDSFRINVNKVYDVVNEDDDNIYYVIGEDQYCVKPKYLQYVLMDRTIHVINEEDIESLEEGSWIISDNYLDIDEDIIIESGFYRLYKINNKPLWWR